MSGLSAYAESLSFEAKKRYLQKISSINNIDPYLLKESEFDNNFVELPRVDRERIKDYLIFNISPATQTEIRAHKSMEAYAQVVCNWVSRVYVTKINETFLLFGYVMHSQRLNLPPLKPWVTLSSVGEILNGHCDCVAGIGEACTHVAAILFAIDKLQDNPESVTDIFAYWKRPLKKPDLKHTIHEIDWSTPDALDTERVDKSIAQSVSNVPKATKDDVLQLLRNFKEAGCEAAAHRVVKEFCTLDESSSLPQNLLQLYSEANEVDGTDRSSV